MKSTLLALILICSTTAFAKPVKYADSYSIESIAFDEPREIMVALPESYDSNPSALYPVIYTVRGQLDLLSVVAAIDMLASEAPEFIVVGISGSGSEFIPSKNREQTDFSRLLHNEVVPHIEKEYRVAPFSILVGHSAAAKFVTNDWLANGSDFSSYYAISPELHNGAINTLAKSLNEKEIVKKSPLLISMGNEDKRMQSMFDELNTLGTLKAKVSFIQYNDHTHMSGRVNTVMSGLRSSFNNWKPSKKVESGQFEVLQAHYHELSKRFGYEVAIPLETMKRESAFHSASNSKERWQVAYDIIEYALTKTTNDADEFFGIADEMIGYGMIEGSARLVSYICEQLPDHSKCK